MPQNDHEIDNAFSMIKPAGLKTHHYEPERGPPQKAASTKARSESTGVGATEASSLLRWPENLRGKVRLVDGTLWSESGKLQKGPIVGR
jgi:hypothetical protein